MYSDTLIMELRENRTYKYCVKRIGLHLLDTSRRHIFNSGQKKSLVMQLTAIMIVNYKRFGVRQNGPVLIALIRINYPSIDVIVA